MKKYAYAFLAAGLVLASAASADAAAVRSGATAQAIAGLVRGNAVAYDSINKVYLVVGSHGVLRGRFVSPEGIPLGLPFTIQANTAAHAHFPRVAFSPHADGGAGGFLVTWHEGAPSTHARMVSYGKNGAYGNDTQVAPEVTWWEAGSAVAYSTESREFLVAWRRLAGPGVNNDIRAVRLDNTATPKAGVFNITNDVHYNDNPSIAYNSASDEFMVVYTGFHDAGNFAYVDSQRVKAGTGAVLGAVTRLVQTGGTYITDVTYNSSTGKYLAAWYSLPAGAGLGRVISADGSLSGNIIALSTRWKAYDALSVAYNRRSDTFFMVSHGSTAEDGGVEIDSNGNAVDNGFVVTGAGGTGNFHPRLAASADDATWLVSSANSFTSTITQLVAGTAVVNTQQPTPKMSIDTPGGLVAQPVWFAGWAADLGSTSGSGADAVHVWAWPDSGAAPIFAGAATPGMIARPDVGAAYGSRFAASGFGLYLNPLPGGSYTLVAYMRSTVAGAFNHAQAVRVTVPEPLMSIDTPGSNGVVPSSGFAVGGWAVDRGASSGTGVDTLHLWARRESDNTWWWAGVASYGGPRVDIGALKGARFTNSGYNAIVTTLPPGHYELVVYSHSTVTGTFNTARSLRIVVQ